MTDCLAKTFAAAFAELSVVVLVLPLMAGDTVFASLPFASSPIPEYNWPPPPWNIGATSKDSVFAELSSEGTLIIRGKGNMMDFDTDLVSFNPDNRPWHKICRRESIKVAIDSGVTNIGECAFVYCDLASITIPSSVTSIGDRAFAISKLGSIIIPNGVTSIGNSAFALSKLSSSSITIPNSVTSIGHYAFGYCNITSITIPSGVTSIGDFAFYKSELTSIAISSSVISIGKNAFAESKLTSIAIPSSVTSIGDFAFAESKLTSITIPNGVTSIGMMTFSDCKNLNSIIILNPIPPSIHWKGFAGVNKETCILYVPKSSVDAYRKAHGWGEFRNIKVIE